MLGTVTSAIEENNSFHTVITYCTIKLDDDMIQKLSSCTVLHIFMYVLQYCTHFGGIDDVDVALVGLLDLRFYNQTTNAFQIRYYIEYLGEISDS